MNKPSIFSINHQLMVNWGWVINIDLALPNIITIYHPSHPITTMVAMSVVGLQLQAGSLPEIPRPPGTSSLPVAMAGWDPGKVAVSRLVELRELRYHAGVACW